MFFFQGLSSVKEPSFFAQNTGALLNRVYDGETVEARDQELSAFAKKVLELGKKWPSVDWRQFALMHNSSILHGSEFEGGSIKFSLSAWRQIFQQWKQREGLFFSMDLSDKVIGQIGGILDDVELFHSLLPPLAFSALSGDEVRGYAKKIQENLKLRLKAQGTVYLPLGYRHGVSNEGHAIPCKCVWEKEGVAIYPLNLGAGSGSHPLLNFTTSQEKIAFRNFPIRVSHDRFWGDMGLAAWCHSVRYLTDPPHPDVDHYRGEDLYDVFYTLGTVTPNLGAPPETLEAKGQRYPTCSEKGVKNIVHDVLVDLNVAPAEIKKIFLNVYFCSLIAGYHACCKDPTLTHRHLLNNAVEELGVTLLKLKGEIPREEFLGAICLLEEIKKETQKLAETTIPKPLPATPKNEPPPPSGFPGYRKKVISEKTRAKSEAPEKYGSPFNIPKFEITFFEKQIDEWMKISETLPAYEGFKFFAACISQLPIPEYSKKDVWDTVPPQQVKGLLMKMEKFLYVVFNRSTDGSVFLIDKILASHTLYVIVDKLARLCPWTFLEGYASPFVPHLVNLEPADFTSLPIGKDNIRYAKISKYFKEQRKHCEEKVIFPIDSKLSIDAYQRDAIQGGNWSQGKNHILFLKKHLFSRYPQASNALLTPLYQYLWKNTETELPREIYSLYYCALLSRQVFFSEERPERLAFKEGVDDSGRPALLIESIREREKSSWEDRQIEGFDEMGIPWSKEFIGISQGPPPLPIFGKQQRKLNTNDAVCARIGGIYQISEPVYRDLLRITRRDNLKIPLALHWLTTNLVYLEHSSIQKVLDHCFFHPGDLAERLREEPQYIDALREAIQKALEYYRENPNHLKAILFLLRTGIFFETHYEEIYGSGKSATFFQFYKEKLEKLLKANLKKGEPDEVRLHWLIVESLRKQTSEEEVVTYLKQVLKFTSLSGPKDGWKLKSHIDSMIWKRLVTLKSYFTDKECCNRICNALFQDTLPDLFLQLGSKEWSGEFPFLTCGEYLINLMDWRVEHRAKGHLKEISHISAFPGFQHYKKKYGDKFWEINDGIAESIQGGLKLDYYAEHGCVCELELIFGGEKRWGRLYQHPFEFKNDNKVCWRPFFDNDYAWNGKFTYNCFTLKDKKPGDPDFVLWNFETQEPFVRIDYTSQGVVFTKLDKWGMTLPIELVNLQDKSKPLANSLLKYGFPSDIFCWVNKKTQEVEELNFRNLDLQFKGGSGGLESLQLPGYFLQMEETLEELHHFPSAMILKNREGDKKVIIPSYKLKLGSSDFLPTLSIADQHFAGEKYYLFQVDPIEGSLHNKHEIANLYLAFLLRMQGDGARALKYLRKIGSSGFFDRNIFSVVTSFTKNSERTPAALAFNAKLFYMILDNKNLMIEAQFGNHKKDETFEELLEWGQETYINYLRSVSREDLSAIPKGLRLSPEEEKILLRRLKKRSEEREIALPQQLTLRYQNLCGGKEELKATITPKKISFRPPAYAKLLPPSNFKNHKMEGKSDFPYGIKRLFKAEPGENLECLPYTNRLTKGAIETYFPALFEIAKRCQAGEPAPFDFVLLACLKGSYLGHLLFYVRHFPHLFSDLSFMGVNDQKLIQDFNTLIERLVDLENQESYKNFKQKFLGESGVFEFCRETILTVPNPNPPKGIIPLEREKGKWTKKPFKSLCELLYIKQLQVNALPEIPPFVDPTLTPAHDTLEGDLHANFLEGYEKLKKRKTYSYTYQDAQLEQALQVMKDEKTRIHNTLVEKRKELICTLNTPYKVRKGKLTAVPFFEEMELRLKTMAHQTVSILPETVMKEVILKNNASYLLQHCPLLSEEESTRVINHVCDYYYLLVLYRQCGESVELMEKIKKEPTNQTHQGDLAALLDYSFYDPRAYPEISYVKVTEGKLPRKGQLAIYKWVCDGFAKRENRLFQFKAGGGKTDYLTPLFMLRARREGLMPIFFSTQTIYTVDRENLSATLKKLDENLCYLEVGMHMKLSAEELQFIYTQLTHYHKEGRGLIMTPQTYYALHLQYLFAGIKEKDQEKVKYLSLILDFFKTHSLQIGDESHRNFDPLTRAIFGVGSFYLLPKEEHTLFLALLKPLLGFQTVMCDNQVPLSKVCRLEKNLVGTPSDEEVERGQRALAEHMSQSPLLNIPQEERKALITYWTDKKAAQPEYLRKLAEQDRQKAGLIALTGYFLLDLLPQIVHMRTELDHAPSIYPEEEFDTPCHHKTPSAAQYEDPHLSESVSTKGTAHRGLSDTQLRKLLETLLQKDWKEFREIQNSGTQSAQLFTDWVSGTSLDGLHLRDVSLSNPKQVESLTQVLSKHPAVIEYYLLTVILPKIGYSLEQLTSTPAHLFYSCALSLLFSATPHSEKIYSRGLQKILYDPAFEAEVVSEYCKEKNQNKIFVEGPETFFNEMEEKHKDLLQSTHVLLDPAGFFCDLSNEEAAKKWLSSSSLDGVFYFKEGRSLGVNKNEKVCLLLKSDLAHPIEIEGSNVKEALAEKKLKWEELKLGTYYDAAHTESANILQKQGTTAFVFVADNLPASRLIQALMRLRGLLDEKMVQKIVWIYPHEVAKKIKRGESKQLDGKAMYAWSVKNEVEPVRKQIILNGFQEISYQIEKIAADELKTHLRDPAAQIAVMEKYSKGLLETHEHDNYTAYGDHESENDSEVVLTGYARTLYNRYGYALSFETNTKLITTLNAIIADVKSRIKKISTHVKKTISLEIEQHIRLKQENEQLHYRPRPFDPLSAEGIYGCTDVDTPDYPYIINIKQGREVFKSEGLTNNLFFEINQLRTAKRNSKEQMEEKYLKPIDFFLIIIPEYGNPMAIAHANEIVSSTLDTLGKECVNPLVNHKAFLVSAEGKVLQRGKGVLAPTSEQVSTIMHSQWMEDLIADAALLKGQIVNPVRLKERIATWNGFADFWTTVVDSQPNPETCNRNAISRLLTKES